MVDFATMLILHSFVSHLSSIILIDLVVSQMVRSSASPVCKSCFIGKVSCSNSKNYPLAQNEKALIDLLKQRFFLLFDF